MIGQGSSSEYEVDGVPHLNAGVDSQNVHRCETGAPLSPAPIGTTGIPTPVAIAVTVKRIPARKMSHGIASSSPPLRDQEKGHAYHLDDTYREKPTTEFIEHVAADAGESSILEVHDDPKLTRRLLWKLDLRILPMLALLFLFSFLDRSVVPPC